MLLHRALTTVMSQTTDESETVARRNPAKKAVTQERLSLFVEPHVLAVGVTPKSRMLCPVTRASACRVVSSGNHGLPRYEDIPWSKVKESSTYLFTSQTLPTLTHRR
jgi:hypothetical protein